MQDIRSFERSARLDMAHFQCIFTSYVASNNKNIYDYVSRQLFSTTAAAVVPGDAVTHDVWKPFLKRLDDLPVSAVKKMCIEVRNDVKRIAREQATAPIQGVGGGGDGDDDA